MDDTKHGAARALIDAALRARAEGALGQSEMLFDEARRVDPEAVADAILELEAGAPIPGDPSNDAGTASDEEVAAISRTLEPHADAPSRSGITGSGSGADRM